MDHVEENSTLPSKQTEAPLWKKLMAPILMLLAFLGKFKGLLSAVKFLPFLLKTGGTMILSIGVYAWMWGWQFAVGFVLLLFIHECGHLVAARQSGLKVGLPVFIPFMGAVIALKDAPRNAWIEAKVGIGGPLLGTAGALACLMGYEWLRYPLLLALAYSGFWLNLFNLIPILPLDGGRIVTAISPWLWLVGIVLMIPILVGFSFNPFLIFIVALSLPRLISLFRKRTEAEQRFYDLNAVQRLWMSLQYFGLAGALAYLMHTTHLRLEVLRGSAF